MNILITAPFETEKIEALKKDFNVKYESWFKTGQIYKGRKLWERLKTERIGIFVTEEDIVSREVLDDLPDLKMICVCRGTPSNVNLTAAAEHNVVVTNTPGRNAVSVASLQSE